MDDFNQKYMGFIFTSTIKDTKFYIGYCDEEDLVKIFWMGDDKIENTKHSRRHVIKEIESGSWILDKKMLRKKKLKRMIGVDDFKRTI